MVCGQADQFAAGAAGWLEVLSRDLDEAELDWSPVLSELNEERCRFPFGTIGEFAAVEAQDPFLEIGVMVCPTFFISESEIYPFVRKEAVYERVLECGLTGTDCTCGKQAVPAV